MVKGGHWSLSPSSMDVSNDLYMLLISWWVISQLGPDTFNSGLDLRFNLAIRFSIRYPYLGGQVECRLGHPLLLSHLEVVLLIPFADLAARPQGRINLLALWVLAFA